MRSISGFHFTWRCISFFKPRYNGSLILSFDVVVEMNLDEEAIMEDVEKLLLLAHSFGIDYDGWGTYPEE